MSPVLINDLRLSAELPDVPLPCHCTSSPAPASTTFHCWPTWSPPRGRRALLPDRPTAGHGPSPSIRAAHPTRNGRPSRPPARPLSTPALGSYNASCNDAHCLEFSDAYHQAFHPDRDDRTTMGYATTATSHSPTTTVTSASSTWR